MSLRESHIQYFSRLSDKRETKQGLQLHQQDSQEMQSPTPFWGNHSLIGKDKLAKRRPRVCIRCEVGAAAFRIKNVFGRLYTECWPWHVEFGSLHMSRRGYGLELWLPHRLKKNQTRRHQDWSELGQ